MFKDLSRGAVLAKAHAMHGNLLTAQDYDELLRKRSVNEIADYLKNSACYRDILGDINENSIHRGHLESLLRRDLYDKYTRLCHYEVSRTESFFSYFITDAETDQILRCIMYINAEKSEDFITKLPGFLIEHASFDLLSLAHAHTIDELILALNHTPYAKIIAQVRENHKDDYTHYEIALKTYVYSNFINIVEKKSGKKQRKELLTLIKTSVELLNISTIYRCKLIFKKSDEEIRQLIIPFWCKYTQKTVDKLLEAEDESSFLKLFDSSAYGKTSEHIDFNYIKNYTERIKFALNKRILYFSTNPLSVLYAFVTLCQIQIFNVTNIIEGVRYNLETKDIEKLLVK